MDCVENSSICYCCVWKGGEVLYSYNNSGEHEIEDLAALCLEMSPPYHRWYFETTDKRTFGFFMCEGYVYFAIVNESVVGNSQVLRFLEKLRDEFRRVGKGGLSTLNSLCLREQMRPVVGHLVASLEEHHGELTPSPPCNNRNEGSGSTKAPLLGRPSKHEKKKKKKKRMKDHVIGMRDIEMEELRRSSDTGAVDSHNQGTSASQMRKDLNPASSQNLHNKWCRQVQIVLAIDAAVCVILFVIWLVICHGTECIR